uniref:Uncharacterized protein n=1 Tax=Romanomermis culicivorax TaxID=13658 RepID=A0A915JZB8_ROMCU
MAITAVAMTVVAMADVAVVIFVFVQSLELIEFVLPIDYIFLLPFGELLFPTHAEKEKQKERTNSKNEQRILEHFVGKTTGWIKRFAKDEIDLVAVHNAHPSGPCLSAGPVREEERGSSIKKIPSTIGVHGKSRNSKACHSCRSKFSGLAFNRHSRTKVTFKYGSYLVTLQFKL